MQCAQLHPRWEHMRHFPQPLSANSTIIKTACLHHNTSYSCPKAAISAWMGMSQILGGQNLLQGLSNYTPSSVPPRWLHYFFLTHDCICCFIFYGCGIMGENGGACLSSAPLLFLQWWQSIVSLFHGEALSKIDFKIAQPPQCIESTDIRGLCILLWLSNLAAGLRHEVCFFLLAENRRAAKKWVNSEPTFQGGIVNKENTLALLDLSYGAGLRFVLQLNQQHSSLCTQWSLYRRIYYASQTLDLLPSVRGFSSYPCKPRKCFN